MTAVPGASFIEPDIARAMRLCPAAFTSISRALAKRISFGAVLVAAMAYGLSSFGFFDATRMIGGLSRLATVLALMVPPEAGGSAGEYVFALFQSVGMALLGTLFATILALPLGLAGSRNVVPSKLVHLVIRRVADFLRGVDPLIWGLVFVSAVGLGPFAGILALTVADTGSLAKLFAEAIENVRKTQIEGVRATGANRIQIIRFGILPQVAPIMVSNILYRLESNTRSASVLGAIGAGGVGFHLFEQMRANRWKEVCLIILLIVCAVGIIDRISARIRITLT